MHSRDVSESGHESRAVLSVEMVKDMKAIHQVGRTE